MDFQQALVHLTQSERPTVILKSFIGGYNFVSSSEKGKEYVAFKFKEPAKQGINYCKLSVDEAMDYYVLELGRVNKFDYEMKVETKGLGWIDLKGEFEQETGLYLSFT